MQVVFLNQFERVTGQTEDRAQVFIGEVQGIWSAGWRSVQLETSAVEDVWYEGMSWEELLAAFRHGVASKMKEGFQPLIDGMLEETPFWERRPALPLLLQCYADSHEAEEVVSALRVWRRTKSVEEKKSAYLIATNRELQMLAVFLPKTLEELGQIPGFGKVKTERYGNDLIELLKDMERNHTFPLEAWVTAAVSEDQLSSWMFQVKEEKYGKVLATVQEKRSLLLGIREGWTLGQLEGELNCPRRKLLERIERLDEEGYDVLPVVDKELLELAPEESLQIETALQQLGDKYLKPLLRKVYGESGSNEQEVERQYEKLRMMRIRFRRVSKAVG
ncbi:HRDC domain-containing protein [Cohnella silvisoli]|uniref:HRDC domain-containing protein n=1 Tax=Cohnella silvisoli TaxID=2873699 RepID=A0ABV1KYS2_9BACL|nr:HRDC domain-containing protein [Cohnella silvisoli]MCD9024237.1 HRDC domain-containing protein [Cohnella silvisoli]